MKHIIPIILFLIIGISQFTSAQIPQTMSYQGVLTGIDGSPVPDGTASLTFRLYNSSENGDTLWQETQSVQVTNGIFNVILGNKTPLNLPFDEQYWLGVTINSGTELIPRVALTASPYSLNSHSTIAETEPGQGLTIRDLGGEVTHQFDASGDVTHSGVGKFLGGIIVGDTIIVPLDTSGNKIATTKSFELSKAINDDLPIFGIKGAGSDVGVFGAGGNIGVYGQSKGTSGVGILGYNETNYGVFGKSISGVGVGAATENGEGVVGSSKTNNGVHGFSEIAKGVFGQSESGTGVWGISQTGRGVIGESNS